MENSTDSLDSQWVVLTGTMANNSSSNGSIDLTKDDIEQYAEVLPDHSEGVANSDDEFKTPAKSPGKKDKKMKVPDAPKRGKKRKATATKLSQKDAFKAEVESKPKKRGRWDTKIMVSAKANVSEILFRVVYKDQGPEVQVREIVDQV